MSQAKKQTDHNNKQLPFYPRVRYKSVVI